MIEKYAIKMRYGSSVPSGTYKTNRLGRKVPVMKYLTEFETDAGMFTEDEWRIKIAEVIKKEGETDKLNIIINHCKKNCAWLHDEQDILDYSMDILAKKSYLSGYDVWQDVIDELKKNNLL